MPEVPECLNRRYKALDELISEINDMSKSSHADCVDPSVKLMCNFWNILKDDPCCNLTEEVQHCFPPPSQETSYCSYIPSSHQKISFTQPQRVTCYMASREFNTGDSESPSGNRKCAPGGNQQSCSHQSQSQTPPLNKVLNNLKDAASHDNNCNIKLKELLAVEKNLRNQITRLELKEKDGVNLMKEADKMWSGMEDAYKEKIAESLERQNDLMTQLQDIENSAAKWRKNKRDLEAQLDSINQCQLDMVAKINQKSNDIKAIDGEIAAYKRRMEETKKECESIKKTLPNKRQASNARLAKIAQEISKLEKNLREENIKKADKEKNGKSFVTEAREELQKICKVLMQRKLEREDLEAEKKALLEEINLLKDTCDNCKERCNKKQKSLTEELKKIDIEIANYKVKCLRCNQCVDTADARTLCTDCPRCIAQRECVVGDSQCTKDLAEECICFTVKRKFLDNVFDNMSTVLEKKVKTKGGKAIGTEIVECLKKSRNGKLNEFTRKMLQEFVLQTVKKNLNLTIVGGAIKTRCEMDDATYKQLLLCLKGIKPTPPPKADKGTDVKKEPCPRFGGECHCPKGPKNCVCKRKAPPAVEDPASCPPEPPPPDPGEKDTCPHKDKHPCGPECGAYAPDRVGADVAKFRPDPCAGSSCPFGKNMRAAQCVLGPESLKSVPSCNKCPSGQQKYACFEDQMQFTSKPVCSCPKDSKQMVANKCKKSEFLCKQTPKLKRPKSEVNPFKLIFDDPRKLKDNGTDTLVNFPKKNNLKDIEYININTLPSGAVNIELSDTFYTKLQANAKGNQAYFVYLRETASGRYYIDINPDGKTPTAKLRVNQSASGLAFDVVRETITKTPPSPSISSLGSAIRSSTQSIEVIRKGKTGDSNAKPKSSQYYTEDEQKAIRYIIEVKHKKTRRRLEAQIEEDVLRKENTNELGKEKEKKYSTWNKDFIKLVGKSAYYDDIDFMNLQLARDQESSTTQLKSELEMFYDRNNKNLSVCVRAKNGTLANIDAFVTKTISGNIALDVHKLQTLGTISSLETGSPVLLEKSLSGSYKVNIGYSNSKDQRDPNAVLLKIKPNGLLIVFNNSIPNSSLTIVKPDTDEKKVYKVKLKGPSYEEKIPPVVLKPSPSFNYFIEMDKEFERKYRESLNSCIDESGECFVTLHKTDSHVSVKFDEYRKNAILFKTPSNTLKVLVNGPIFENLAGTRRDTIQSAKQFEGLISKIPTTRRPSRNSQSTSAGHTFAKSISDPYLYNTVNMKQSNILAEPSCKLQKIDLGQYAAILDKESKKSFVNDLKNSLVSSPQGRVPIKKTDSGQTIIMLDADEVENSQYGSLKFTSSGNFYVMVDKNVINELKVKDNEMARTLPSSGHRNIMSESKEKHKQNGGGSPSSVNLEVGSEHMIGKVKYPKHQSTAKPRISPSSGHKNIMSDSKEKDIENGGGSPSSVNLEVGSEHMIGKVKYPKHQSTATTLERDSHGKDCKCVHNPEQKKYEGCENCRDLKSVVNPAASKSENESCSIDCCTSKGRNPYKIRNEDSCYYCNEIRYDFEDKLKSLSQEIFDVTCLCQRVLNDRTLATDSKKIALNVNNQILF